MFVLAALRGRSATKFTRTFATGVTPFYTPTLTEKRYGEAGRGGRMSEAGCKVAVFGASGFLGNFVCAELGTFVRGRSCFRIFEMKLNSPPRF
jgi:hypothetical protein